MIYTFYSYKGGVGRSMAMAGVAYLFAQRGLKVLAIDFDLEAPGLERYFFESERCKLVRGQSGLLNLIQDYRTALTSEAAFNKGDFKRWQRYCTPAIHTTGAKRGSVDLMTAGCREPETALRDYALAVRSFDWQAFFFNAKGDLFFDWLRRRLLEPETGYDVVLVDSRTGVTEMGGVCAYQLADVAVLLCAANFQNLEGTRDVARDFRSESVLALRLGRPLELVAVPARIEPDHPGRSEFLARFKAELGVEGMPMVLADAGLDYERLAIPYDPAFAFAERLVGEPSLTGDLKRAPVDLFECLTDALTLLAPAGSRLHAQREAALARVAGTEASATAPILADTTKSSAGYDAFMDYAYEDHAVVSELTSVLERAGFSVYQEQRSITPGTDFVAALDHALEYSHTLLVAFGKPTSSEFRARLIARARRLQTIRIVPLLLPGSDVNALASFDLSESQSLDLRDWSQPNSREMLFASLASLLRQRQASAAPIIPLVDPLPYVGQRAYGEDSAAFLFGREAEIQQVVALLESHHVIRITGPAKVGKTSLAHAGVLPKLRQLKTDHGEPRFRCIESLDLSIDHPTATMLQAASRADVLILDGVDTFEHGGRESDRAGRLDLLIKLLQSVRTDCRLILLARDVLDQSEREAAIRAIDTCLQGRSTAHFPLRPMKREALLLAMQGPAELAGHLLEPGLAERLIESVGASVSGIAQIQRALAAIWPERKRGWLTNRSLDATGHVDRLAEAQFQAVLAKLEPDALAATQALVLRLVTLSGRRELLPSKQDWERVSTMPLLVAMDAVGLRDQLVAEGMFDIYREEKSEAGADQESTLKIALARQCVTAYFDETKAEINLKYLLWRDALAVQIRLWHEGKNESLLRSSGLVEAEQWLDSLPQLFTRSESDFLQASIAERDKREKEKHARLAAEQEQRQRHEHERLGAAEQLAREASHRADVEMRARSDAQVAATHLRHSRYALSVALAVAIGLLMVAVSKWNVEIVLRKQEIVLRKQETELRKQATADRIRAEELTRSAQAETRSAQVALDEMKKAQVAQDRLQQSAESLNAAAFSVLNAEDTPSRRSAAPALAAARIDLIRATEALTEIRPDCPAGRQLYLHIADENDRAWARELIPVLEKGGFIVPGIVLTNVSPRTSDVRYFRLRDQVGATDATRLLQNAGVVSLQENYISGREASDNIRPCHYEAWFVAGASRAPVTETSRSAGVTTIRYYRDSDRELVQEVATRLGFNAEKGASKLIGLSPSVLAYSSDISTADRIAVAGAFVEAGFPLRAMGPATKVTDKQLIQVIASGPAESKCQLLTVADIQAGKVCGGK